MSPVHLALYLVSLLADHLEPDPAPVLFFHGAFAAVPAGVVALNYDNNLIGIVSSDCIVYRQFRC
jgi:hypothetical protein